MRASCLMCNDFTYLASSSSNIVQTRRGYQFYHLSSARIGFMSTMVERNRLPTLFEVLSRRAPPPVDLFLFYIFIRDHRGLLPTLASDMKNPPKPLCSTTLRWLFPSEITLADVYFRLGIAQRISLRRNYVHDNKEEGRGADGRF